MKKRISITIDEDILRLIDDLVDEKRGKNRSNVIENILIEKLKLRKPKYSINNIILSVGFKKEFIKEYFGNGSRFGVNIIYVEEDEPLGTGGPLNLARKYLNDTFIVSNGDELKDFDLNDMFLFHKKNNALVTMALTYHDNPKSYGSVILKGDKIIEFVEKGKKVKSNLINAGLYIMEPEVVKYIKKGYFSLEHDLFPKLAKKNKLYGYHFYGQWYDTGTFERYEEAIKKWKPIN